MSSIELPSGWTVAPIEDLLAKQSDGRTIHQGWSPQCLKEPRNADEWAILKTTAIQPGKFEHEHNKKLPAQLAPRPAIEVSDGDLLITCAGPRVRCGVSCLVKSIVPHLMLSGKMYRFRPEPSAMDARYLEAFLQSDEAQFAIDRMKTGGSESGLNLTHDRFKRLEVRFAPIAEQVRIVVKLEELFSDLDAAVAELKAAQRKLAQYRQSLLKAAVEGALTADWRTAHGEPKETGADLLQRILRERRARWEAKQLAKFAEQGKAPSKGWQAKYPELVAPDTTDLPVLPVGWTWASLDQLLTQLRSGTAETSGRDSTMFPVLKSSAVRQGSIDFSALNYLSAEQSRPENMLEVGDLLITRLSGSVEYVGCTAVVDVLPNAGLQYPDRIFCGKPVPGVPYLGEYLVHCLRSPRARLRIEVAAKSTAGHKRISLSDLYSFPIPLPPSEEKNAIVEQLTATLAATKEQEVAIARSLQQAAAQRSNILKAAFAGQLVPQDPDDEPASALLARIRVERMADVEAKSHRVRRKNAP